MSCKNCPECGESKYVTEYASGLLYCENCEAWRDPDDYTAEDAAADKADAEFHDLRDNGLI